jgi:hypothetical protein
VGLLLALEVNLVGQFRLDVFIGGGTKSTLSKAVCTLAFKTHMVKIAITRTKLTTMEFKTET